MKESDIMELLDLIAGRGRWTWSGSAGFHSYPGADENQDKIHAACTELEERGLVFRHIDDPGHVCWKESANAEDNTRA